MKSVFKDLLYEPKIFGLSSVKVIHGGTNLWGVDKHGGSGTNMGEGDKHGGRGDKVGTGTGTSGCPCLYRTTTRCFAPKGLRTMKFEKNNVVT